MFTNLYAVVAARAVNQEFVIDINGYMMDVQPTLTFATAAAISITALFITARWVKAREENQVSCLQLRRIGKETAHFLTSFSHIDGRFSVHGGKAAVVIGGSCKL